MNYSYANSVWRMTVVNKYTLRLAEQKPPHRVMLMPEWLWRKLNSTGEIQKA